MNHSEFSRIRHTLDMTQNELSRILCVSPKAIQSFEQGWRNVPTYIEREMLLLLQLTQSVNIDTPGIPCWEIKNCPDSWRKNCLVWKLQVHQFCWFINGSFCQGEYQQNWEKKIRLCRQCEVFHSPQ